MRRTLEPVDAAARAAAHAREAARRVGVEIAPLADIDAIHRASALFEEVWGTNGTNVQMPPELVRALVHSGNYAAGAYASGELAGAIVAVLGRSDDGVFLHSHILGVSAERRGRSVGFALKQHQRAWALEHGIDKVTWTFDPLVRRNAYFNVQKLGAHASDYYESFYGVMRDEINAGDETDRLYVVWQLDGPRAEQAASSRIPEPDVFEGAHVALSESGKRSEGAADVLLCATPSDVVELRRRSPDEARRWRHALRSTLGEAMHDGYCVVGFTRSGWYVLERDGDERS